MTTHKILLSGKPVNIHNRMMTRHNVVTRAATGVSRGFGNLVMRSSFNHSATTYNSLPVKIMETTSLARFKSQLRCWVEKILICNNGNLNIVSSVSYLTTMLSTYL